jgi:predicted MFS family arabinose efflux permease
VRTTDEARGRYRDALAVPEFRAIFAANTISIAGSVVSAVALTVLVFQRTGSPLLSSLTFALGFLPFLVGGTLLSAVVDRVRPRRLLVGCDLAAAGLTALMAWPGAPIPLLLALLVATGVLMSISSGAKGGLVRSLVSEAAYVPARSLLRIAAQAAQIGGNAVGGALLVVLTPSGAILVDAASFLLSACLIRYGLRNLRYDSRFDAGAAATPLVRDSLAGMRTVLGHAPLRRLLLLGWLVPMFAVAPEAVAAPYVSGEGGSPALVGWWLVALPVGMIAGDLLGVWLLTPRRLRRLVGPVAALAFAPYLLFVASPPIPVAIALLVVSGLCAVHSLGLDAIVRDTAPESIFARTMALNTAGLMTLQGLGFALAGAVAEVVGPSLAIAAAGAAGLTTVALLYPSMAVSSAPWRAEHGAERAGAGME